MVAFRPLCEAIGVDADSQAKKLRTRSWATTVLTTVVASDGKRREMLMVDRRTLTMWLATLNENRVSDEVRPTVVAFQNEAADALDNYFHERKTLNTFDYLRQQLDQIEAAHNLASEAKAIAVTTEARLDAIEGRHNWFSALGYAKANGLNTNKPYLAKIGRQASMIAKTHDVEPAKVQHAHYGTVNSYPSWIWELAVADK